jgi:hypothetical protein
MNITPRPAYFRKRSKVATDENAGRVTEAVWMILENGSYFPLPVFEMRTVESVASRYIPTTISCLTFLLIRVS